MLAGNNNVQVEAQTEKITANNGFEGDKKRNFLDSNCCLPLFIIKIQCGIVAYRIHTLAYFVSSDLTTPTHQLKLLSWIMSIHRLSNHPILSSFFSSHLLIVCYTYGSKLWMTIKSLKRSNQRLRWIFNVHIQRVASREQYNTTLCNNYNMIA